MFLTNLGSVCFGHFMLKHLHEHTNQYKPLFCPFGNMGFSKGFSDVHKIFTGEFYKELFEEPLKIKKDIYIGNDNRHIPSFKTEHLLVVHNNMENEKDVMYLKERYDLFVKTLSSTEEVRFLYSLSPSDINKSIDEIYTACELLKPHIDLNKLYIVGSISNKNLPGWYFDYRNSNFKEIFGNRYVEIKNANSGHMSNCCKQLLKML